jgi:hypothetical protein
VLAGVQAARRIEEAAEQGRGVATAWNVSRHRIHRGQAAVTAPVMTDALKLLWVEAAFYLAGARNILLFSDEAAAAHFRGSSWMAAALAHFDIEVRVVDLPADHCEAVRRAQGRQFR